MAKKNITIIDVARVAGVSKSTVSLAMQDSPKIRTDTKKRVISAARSLGYIYNRAAANLGGKSLDFVGIIINDLLNPHFAELTVAIESVLTDTGFLVAQVNTSESIDKQKRVIRSLGEFGATGVIICPAIGTESEFIKYIQSYGMAVVTVDRSVPNANCDHVAADAADGMRQAAEHLINKGVTRLAFIGGDPTSGSYRERIAGVAEACDAAASEVDVRYYPCEISRQAAKSAIAELLKEDPQPQGILCYNDIVAFGAINGLTRSGITVGHDVALVGYDNTVGASEIHPSLTSVDVFVESIGKKAAETLLKRISNPEMPTARQLVSPQLLVRESSQSHSGKDKDPPRS